MTERMLFRVLVRMVGVFTLVDGFKQAFYLTVRPIFPESNWRHSINFDLSVTLALVVFGAILIRWPSWIVEFGFPEATEKAEEALSGVQP